MAFVAQAVDGTAIRYVDRKRYLWIASLTAPVIPSVGVGIYFATGGNNLATLFPLLYTFLLVPFMDVIFGEDTPEQLIHAIKPDALVKGAEYTADQVPGAKFVQAHGGRVVLLEMVQGKSTTAIVARARETQSKH